MLTVAGHLIRMASPTNPTRKHHGLSYSDVISCDVISGLYRLGAAGRVGSGTSAVDRETQEPAAVRPRSELVEIVVKHRFRKFRLSSSTTSVLAVIQTRGLFLTLTF